LLRRFFFTYLILDQIGALAVVAILFFLPNIPPALVSTTGFWQKIKDLDWIGTVLSLAMVVSLLLPLQWGGNEKAWNAPEVIALLVMVTDLRATFNHKLFP
jgi:hypothetical protein